MTKEKPEIKVDEEGLRGYIYIFKVGIAKYYSACFARFLLVSKLYKMFPLT